MDNLTRQAISALMCGAFFLYPAVSPAAQKVKDVTYNRYNLPDPTKNCFVSAAAYYNLDPWWLYLLAMKETGNRPLNAANSNGSLDRNVMQTNSIHDRDLKRYGIGPDHQKDVCVNVFTGAWLLSKSVARNGETCKAIGGYHSETPYYRERYLAGAIRLYKTIRPANAPSELCDRSGRLSSSPSREEARLKVRPLVLAQLGVQPHPGGAISTKTPEQEYEDVERLLQTTQASLNRPGPNFPETGAQPSIALEPASNAWPPAR